MYTLPDYPLRDRSEVSQMDEMRQRAKRALVIGSSGGIGSALVTALLADTSIACVHTVSRSASDAADARLKHYLVSSVDEDAVSDACKRMQEEGGFSLIFCCIGMLHEASASGQVQPEKKLESINTQTLTHYFQVNTIAPLNWLKNIPKLLPVSIKSTVVFFTARVGSIEDNHLGGWYGYRASKAALNMLIKTAQVELSRRSPQTILVSYHPGTVDSALSKPFQKNIPEGKLLTPEFTVSQLLSILPTLTEQGAPHYIDWQGRPIPW